MVELTSMQLEKEIEENGTPTCVKELFEGEFDELRCSGLLSDESCEMLPPKINNLAGLSTHSQLLSHEASETVLQVGDNQVPITLIVRTNTNFSNRYSLYGLNH